MISEEDKKKIEEAKTCDNCLCWHKHCNAECCKIIRINVPLTTWENARRYIFAHQGERLSWDDVRYFKLHGVDYIRGMLRFRKDRIRIIKGEIIYFHPCKMLEGNLCKVHSSKNRNKPKRCRELTLDCSAKFLEKNIITENCLYKYKKVEVEPDDKSEV